MGPDAQKAADWIFSANMARQPGATVYTCMLNANGGVEADLTVVSIGTLFSLSPFNLLCFSYPHTHHSLLLVLFFPHHSLLLVFTFSLGVLPFLHFSAHFSSSLLVEAEGTLHWNFSEYCMCF